MDYERETRTDGDLLSAASRGERGAFDALYLRHRQWLYRLAFRFTGHDADAWDAVQEAMLYLARNAGRIRLTASLRTLLFSVVRHAAIKANSKRRRLIDGDELLAALPAAVQAAPTELLDVLGALDLLHRQVVILRYVDDLSIDEIAEVLQIPPGTVKSRLFSAQRLLRENPQIKRYFDQP